MLSSSRSGLVTIIVAYLAFIGLGLNSGLIGSSWNQIQTEFQVPLDWLGFLLVASVAGYLTASFIFGTLTMRFGSGRMYIAGGVLLAVGLFGTMSAQSWWMLVAVQFIAGLGSGTIDSGLNVYLAQHHGAKAMNWLHACFGVGWTFSPLIVREVLTAGQSWRVSFGAVAGFILVVAVLFLVTLAWWKSVVVKNEKTPTTEHKSVWATLAMPVVLMGILMFYLYAGVEATPGTWGATYFTKGRGLPEADALTWVSIYLGSFTIGRIFFGFVIEKIKTTTLLRGCMIGALIGAVAFWWNPVAWVGAVGLIVLGFAQAPLFPVMISATPERVGVENAHHAIGFQVAGAGLGVALLPGLLGIIITNLTPGVERFDLIPPFIVLSVILMFGLLEVSVMQSARIRERALAAAGD